MQSGGEKERKEKKKGHYTTSNNCNCLLVPRGSVILKVTPQ